jgi:hypothetical protein
MTRSSTGSRAGVTRAWTARSAPPYDEATSSRLAALGRVLLRQGPGRARSAQQVAGPVSSVSVEVDACRAGSDGVASVKVSSSSDRPASPSRPDAEPIHPRPLRLGQVMPGVLGRANPLISLGEALS